MKSVTYDELKKAAPYHWPGNVRELEHFIEESSHASRTEGNQISGLEQPLKASRNKPGHSQAAQPKWKGAI